MDRQTARPGPRVLKRAVLDQFGVQTAIVAVIDLLGHQPEKARRDWYAGLANVDFERGRHVTARRRGGDTRARHEHAQGQNEKKLSHYYRYLLSIYHVNNPSGYPAKFDGVISSIESEPFVQTIGCGRPVHQAAFAQKIAEIAQLPLALSPGDDDDE
jgi:hypothetical protein